MKIEVTILISRKKCSISRKVIWKPIVHRRCMARLVYFTVRLFWDQLKQYSDDHFESNGMTNILGWFSPWTVKIHLHHHWTSSKYFCLCRYEGSWDPEGVRFVSVGVRVVVIQKWKYFEVCSTPGKLSPELLESGWVVGSLGGDRYGTESTLQC